MGIVSLRAPSNKAMQPAEGLTHGARLQSKSINSTGIMACLPTCPRPALRQGRKSARSRRQAWKQRRKDAVVEPSVPGPSQNKRGIPNKSSPSAVLCGVCGTPRFWLAMWRHMDGFVTIFAASSSKIRPVDRGKSTRLDRPSQSFFHCLDALIVVGPRLVPCGR
jgi:hypothetical protein